MSTADWFAYGALWLVQGVTIVVVARAAWQVRRDRIALEERNHARRQQLES